jgi:S-formylglutathione hydrolase FrmB
VSRLALALLLALTVAAPARADDLTLVGRAQLSGRLTELAFRTPAVTGETHVRVLTPTDYDASGKTRYPVLYLLHGALDDDASWTAKGDAEAITAGYPLIVVMPSSGTGGGYVNWRNGGAFGPPAWETYHLFQLRPWIDAHYPTRATREGRAVAGLSMGGYGTMHYAARHPDLFVSASAFSPAVDLTEQRLSLVNSAVDLIDGPSSAYGGDETYIRGHNPVDLAGNLAGLALTLRTGNGKPGGEDGSFYDPVEETVHIQATTLHRRLDALGIPHTWEDYGAGGHTWYFWQRDLRKTMPALMQTFVHPPKAPSPFFYKTLDDEYRVWGWHVELSRDTALEMSELRGADKRGFELAGLSRGAATVTTARMFKRRAKVRVSVDGRKSTLRADRRGALRLTVPLRAEPVRVRFGRSGR